MSERKHRPLAPELEASLPRVDVDDLIAPLKYYVDDDHPHLWIKDPVVCTGCTAKPCLAFCPVGVYRLDRRGQVMVGYQACVECGSCRVGCPFLNIGWALPRGGYGIAYKFG
ncbi:ferredoxin family protein [Thiococcus pfennigii]|uniref:ferredoxin family protein n=1 Tax=Thiococcus pfennigii TaxID=1057 RepID=UPI001905CA7F|nr:4Fe-4S dicluster domain-containing protein [Thiococcus pfennigii]MBK1700109.1 4Fe-4S ferredoxin [Thiococcus pfennigii]